MWFDEHNEQLRGFRGVASVLTWYDHGFKDVRDVRMISLNGGKNAVVLLSASKNIPKN